MPKLKQPVAYLGIDPGKQGGLALVNSTGIVISYHYMPTTNLDLLGILREWQTQIRFCVVEHVHSMPGEGHSGAFTFGRGYGAVLMGLTAVNVPYEMITPRTWQKELGIVAKKKTETKPQFKDRLRLKAQQLFPAVDLWQQPNSLTKQRAVCDAMLIAEYCRRRVDSMMAMNTDNMLSEKPNAKT